MQELTCVDLSCSPLGLLTLLCTLILLCAFPRGFLSCISNFSILLCTYSFIHISFHLSLASQASPPKHFTCTVPLVSSFLLLFILVTFKVKLSLLSFLQKCLTTVSGCQSANTQQVQVSRSHHSLVNSSLKHLMKKITLAVNYMIKFNCVCDYMF